MLTGEEERALQERDERVKERLLAVIGQNEEEIRALREQIRIFEANSRHIREAAQKEQWWSLRGILDEDDIESLCAISPASLLDS